MFSFDVVNERAARPKLWPWMAGTPEMQEQFPAISKRVDFRDSRSTL
jgi:hypothetical protein